MTNYSLYNRVCFETSQLVTERYSTSFSKATELYAPKIRKHIYNIYGFVRFADEIVDTFHKFKKRELLDSFVDEYHKALDRNISLNPILQSFCTTQKRFGIDQELVDAFLHSMYMDLGDMSSLTHEEYSKYIYGSAEVVGLMCLKIFVEGNDAEYNRLKGFARDFGSALQKVNFLRDLSADYHQLGRVYFPNVDFEQFTEADKTEIENDIQREFDSGWAGIKQLPSHSKYAVELAYLYYSGLLKNIKSTPANQILKQRIRVSDAEKKWLYAKVYAKCKWSQMFQRNTHTQSQKQDELVLDLSTEQ